MMDLFLLRTSKGFRTQVSLAEKSGVCRTIINNIENGKVTDKGISLATFKKLGKALDIDYKELMR